MMVLALIGGLIAVGFAVDTLRMTSDASQLKRATDAAALAIGREYLRSDKDFDALSQTLARNYVRANLGLDSDLRETLSDVSVTRGRNASDNATFEVTARFTSAAALSGNPAQTITVRSKVEAHVAFTEVALVVPSSFDVNPTSQAAMTRISQNFADSLIRQDGHIFMSVVPYSQHVNLYDAKQGNRPKIWAQTSALQPQKLKDNNFFGATGIEDLASSQMPDARGKRFCPSRGLNLGENYFWDRSPGHSFYINYWLGERESIPHISEFPYVDWDKKLTPADIGCNPAVEGDCPDDDFFESNPETYTIAADKGCPATSVLPLISSLDEITSHLNLLRSQHIYYPSLTAGNLNFGFALGWGAMTLAPAFRGSDGWGVDPQVPRDFDAGNGEHQKVIVMLMKTNMDKFFADSDASTNYPGNVPAEGNNWTNISDRYARLCDSLRAPGHRIRVFLLVLGGDADDAKLLRGQSFGNGARPGLLHCSEKQSDISYYKGDRFDAAEPAMKSRLGQVADELKQRGSFVRLIQ